MKSINGHDVIESRTDPRLRLFKVHGTNRHFLCEREAGPILVAAALDWHNTIAPIDEGPWDDWGWAFRLGRMSSNYSDHSAGRAIDINASKEGRQGTGARGWWERKRRVMKMNRILRRYKVLEWGGPADMGGEYHTPSNWDFMHLYIKRGVTDEKLRRVIKRLGIQQDGLRVPPVKAAPADQA